MSNFLKNNQKSEIRARISEDIVLFEPTDEQMEDLKKLVLKENINVDNGLNVTGEISYDVVRYIIKNLCGNGQWVDEYTNEELEQEFENGNKYIKRLRNEIIFLLEEVVENIQYGVYQEINTMSSILNIVDNGIEENKIYEKMAKILKKEGINISAKDFVENKENPEKISEIIENSKKNYNKKNVNKKK